jgi:DNA topoisomerase IA
MAKKTGNKNQPWATLDLQRPSKKAIEFALQDFVEIAESLVEEHNVTTAPSPYIETLSISEVLDVLKSQIAPELTNDLLEMGAYGRGLLMGTVLYVIYENSKDESAEQDEEETDQAI